MGKKIKLDDASLYHVTKTSFSVLPLLRKKLLQIDSVKTEHGLPMSHIQVLSMLGDQPCLSIAMISEKLGINKPNITPLIDRLIEEGYVQRRRNQLDHRSVDILLLPRGREKLDEIQRSIVKNIHDWTGTGIKDSQFKELQNALNSIVKILGRD